MSAKAETPASPVLTNAAFSRYDAIVIGGGFYGCNLAIFLARNRQRVLVVEQEADLLTRASYANQARVHNGYHYPRNLVTALRSCLNFPRFVRDYHECVDSSFEKYYAIARTHSKVSAFQFRRICENIGTPIRPAPASIRRLFDPALIEDVFLTREYAFDAVALKHILLRQLEEANVEVLLGRRVRQLRERNGARVDVEFANGTTLEAGTVYNCAYSGINTILHESGLPVLPMKHELAEIALIEPPEELKGLAVTLMDGPFFSTMPFPARGLYSLTHVRYTPHMNWRDRESFRKPDELLKDQQIETNYPLMIRDASRYLPCLRSARYVDSLFEIKTVLEKNEADDGRPILYRRNYGIPNLCLVMGGKIDNIYDILQMLRDLETAAAAAGASA